MENLNFTRRHNKQMKSDLRWLDHYTCVKFIKCLIFTGIINVVISKVEGVSSFKAIFIQGAFNGKLV